MATHDIPNISLEYRFSVSAQDDQSTTVDTYAYEAPSSPCSTALQGIAPPNHAGGVSPGRVCAPGSPGTMRLAPVAATIAQPVMQYGLQVARWQQTEYLASTQRNIKKCFERRWAHDLPDCFRNANYALLYQAFVMDTFRYLNPDRLENILRAIADMAKQTMYPVSCDWTRLLAQEGTSIIEWTAKLLKTSCWIAALVLGDIIGMKPEKCFRRFPPNKVQNDDKADVTQRATLSKVFAVDTKVFTLEAEYPVRNLSGENIQTVCQYTHAGESLTVYADASRQIGKRFLDAIPPAVDLINHHQSATIHLCLCPDVLWKYLALAKDCRLAEREGIVVTGCFGGKDDFDALDLSHLAFHPVVLICSPDRDEWANLEKVAKRCLGQGASSARVYPWPLDRRRNAMKLPESVVAALRQRAINIDEEESARRIACKINEEAIPYDALSSFKREIGLVAPEAGDIANGAQGRDAVMITGPCTQSCASASIQLETLGAPDLFANDYRTLIVGPSNVGKSFVAQTLAVALALGRKSFFFAQNLPAKVMYCDGEMGESFSPRIGLIAAAYDAVPSDLNEKMKCAHLRGHKLSDTNVREQVINACIELQPQVVFIDNIISLFPEAARGSTDDLLRFVEQLERSGCAVVLVHHTNKAGKDAKGPMELVGLCQNVMHIKGREQIRGQYKKPGEMPQIIAEELASPTGLVICMSFEKCKVCPELEWREFYYRLNMNGAWEDVDIDVSSEDTSAMANNDAVFLESEKAHAKEDNTTSRDSPLTGPSETSTLDQDEQKIMEAVAEKGSIRNADVRNLLGCKESKASELLSGLVERNKLKRVGAGASTRYVPC